MKHLKCRMDLLKSLSFLSDEECARFVRGAVRYAEKGTVPELIGREADLWDQTQADIDRQRGEYAKRVGIVKDARDRKVIDNPIDSPIDNPIDSVINNPINNAIDKPIDNKSTKQTKHFIPPTMEEVEEYCNANGYWVDAQQFCDFYGSKGWMVGSSKMKDWRAAVRNWSKREQERRREKRNNPSQRSGLETLMEMVQNGEI